jgi:plasmid stabilization system protein ParE
MEYGVELTRNAEVDLEELYVSVASQAPIQGGAWFNGLEQAILALARSPRRDRIATKSFDPDNPVRVLNYGRNPHRYRVFFTIDETERVVHVVHLRHGARLRPDRRELKED